jgi:hypothetical protein
MLNSSLSLRFIPDTTRLYFFESLQLQNLQLCKSELDHLRLIIVFELISPGSPEAYCFSSKSH